jgi:hypothetical protein
MPASLLTTVPTPQQIPRGENHQPTFKVIVLALAQHLWFFTVFHHLENKRCARPARAARRAKTTLEILPLEKIINIREESQLPSIIPQR